MQESFQFSPFDTVNQIFLTRLSHDNLYSLILFAFTSIHLYVFYILVCVLMPFIIVMLAALIQFYCIVCLMYFSQRYKSVLFNFKFKPNFLQTMGFKLSRSIPISKVVYISFRVVVRIEVFF